MPLLICPFARTKVLCNCYVAIVDALPIWHVCTRVVDRDARLDGRQRLRLFSHGLVGSALDANTRCWCFCSGLKHRDDQAPQDGFPLLQTHLIETFQLQTQSCHQLE